MDNRSELREIVSSALNSNLYEFEYDQKKMQPYHGLFHTGEKVIDLYIYVWNITSSDRDNKSELRIQLSRNLNDVGIDRANTDSQKTIILGVYKNPNGETVFAAWDTESNRGHAQKSCYVLEEDLAKAVKGGLVSRTDKKGSLIYTMTSDSLGDYVALLQTGNKLDGIQGDGILKEKTNRRTKTDKKQREIRSVEKLRERIASLTQTEQKAVQKVRVGQGYFRELLIDKYGGKCALCAIKTTSVLVASHIKEWAASNDEEKLDENNGILLCAHHDALFDGHLISFTDTGELVVSPSLSQEEIITLSLSSIPKLDIQQGTRMVEYLAFHRLLLKK